MPPYSYQVDTIELTLSKVTILDYTEIKNQDSNTKSWKKTVTWDAVNRVIEIPNRADYSSQEKSLIWTSRAELNRIRQKSARLVQLMNICTFLLPAGTCTRGLEGLIERTKLERRRVKQKALVVVLKEQERQYQDQEYHRIENSNKLAHVYSQATRQCGRAALVTALRDKNDARLIYRELVNRCRAEV